jgi:hypothetical protein
MIHEMVEYSSSIHIIYSSYFRRKKSGRSLDGKYGERRLLHTKAKRKAKKDIQMKGLEKKKEQRAIHGWVTTFGCLN